MLSSVQSGRLPASEKAWITKWMCQDPFGERVGKGRVDFKDEDTGMHASQVRILSMPLAIFLSG
jgi:hypothetical protein